LQALNGGFDIARLLQRRDGFFELFRCESSFGAFQNVILPPAAPGLGLRLLDR